MGMFKKISARMVKGHGRFEDENTSYINIEKDAE
jgi:hypothetical protein